jgi:hypothetical protein
MKYTIGCGFFIVLVSLAGCRTPGQKDVVPGVVIDHVPADTGTYIGSPSICILSDGSYIATHDLFGPASNEHDCAVTLVFRSSDSGKSWSRISEIDGQFWSGLFLHEGDLYIMGTWKHHGNLIIRRSTDRGETWSDPADGETGLIRKGEYHTAPVPVVVHSGRIWRAVENAASSTTEWGKRYSAMVVSAPSEADLLDSASWTSSNFLQYDSLYLDGNFRGWLEGNVVVTPDSKVIDFLRVATKEKGRDMAAVVNISDDGKTASFDPSSGFFDFIGGARKFTIRHDKESGLYWTITNKIGREYSGMDAGSVRNTLVLQSSQDLRKWVVNKVLLFHPDVTMHGFQYVDWQFNGRDIIFVSRTAYDDDSGGAHNFHDANYMTFHRINNFRSFSGREIE